MAARQVIAIIAAMASAAATGETRRDKQPGTDAPGRKQ
jgi:hypothetical protein